MLLPQDFEFSAYLLESIKQHFELVMHLGVVTWFRIAVVMVIVFEVSAFFGAYSYYILLFSGWALLLLGNLIVQHYEWITMELMPMKSNTVTEKVKAKRELGASPCLDPGASAHDHPTARDHSPAHRARRPEVR